MFDVLTQYIKHKVLIVTFSIEKDPHDTSQKAKESQDTSHKILELQKKLDSTRSQVKSHILLRRHTQYNTVVLFAD